MNQNNNTTIKQYNNKILGILMLVGAILFNLYLYRQEPTALVDPNDNAFQFALVDRTNQIWDFASRICPKNLNFAFCTLNYLTDHWVPNWAEGYNLPYYYSHIPQIAIVASYRLVSGVTCHVSGVMCQMSEDTGIARRQNNNITIQQYSNKSMSLFQYYHLIIYLLLCLFPLSVFLALRTVKLPWLTAGIGALVASHISTDGFYGLDPSSFLWRGYGLTSQLFAMIWLPLAIAYGYKYICQKETQDIQKARGKGFLDELKICFQNISVSRILANFHLARIKESDRDRDQAIRASSRNQLPERSSLFYAIFFLTATTSGHLGIGIIAFLSFGIMAIAEPLWRLVNTPQEIVKLINCYIAKKPFSMCQQFNNLAILQLWKNIGKLFILCGTTIAVLSYWIIPLFINSNYHNISVWDPVWKFNSYGVKEVLARLFNGGLFDFDRFPILTILVFIGLFVSLIKQQANRHEAETITGRNNNLAIKQYNNEADLPDSYFPFGVLFVAWVVLYFGRTTWGGLIDLIPGMKEFHLSRFIVGIHLAGIFLIPIGIQWIFQQFNNVTIQQFPRITKLLNYCAATGITVLLIILVYPPTIRYAQYNDVLIKQANNNVLKIKPDIDLLFATLRQLPPGRIFAGRGGSWGKDLKVAETPLFMHLSTYGLPTVLWLPETWSPNSDTEQYFREDKKEDYDLYNIRYIVAPPSQKPQSFWKLFKETPSWKFYIVETASREKVTIEQYNNRTIPSEGYITSGIRPAIVSSDKENYINVVRLWIQSDYHKQGLFPELTFDKAYPKNYGLPNFRMLDEATYKVPDGTTHSLFQEPPTYQVQHDGNVAIQQYNNITISNQLIDSDMIFSAKVTVPENCEECLVVLKQTSHPSWVATVDGKRVETITVFPFYVAVPVDKPGTHEVIFSYQPSPTKTILLFTAIIIVSGIIICEVLDISKKLLRARGAITE